MSVSLRAMRYFSLAIRRGNISAAARELNVAASAVSAAIDQIEAHFDLVLTVRQRARGISATPDGQVMARKFDALIDDYETLMLDGIALKQSFHGDLRVGYYAPVAPAFLPRVLASLMRPEHDLTVHLEACDNNSALNGLRQGNFDVILFVADDIEPGFVFEPLIEAPAYCLVSSKHHLSAQRSVTLDDLAGERLVTLNRPLAGEYYQELFSKAGHAPNVIAHCNTSEMVRSLVGAHNACAVLNMLPLTEFSYAGDRLVARPIRGNLRALTLSIGYRKTAPRRIVTEFVAQCKAYFASPDLLICPPV